VGRTYIYLHKSMPNIGKLRYIQYITYVHTYLRYDTICGYATDGLTKDAAVQELTSPPPSSFNQFNSAMYSVLRTHIWPVPFC
jgi:hypothetical protein